ncbi:leucine-rich repeat-containing protein 23 [Cyclospora cayetanensis]|uniref:Leucine-rich repeat-containing protein 23 n=1 Tax=Cyclospora cayetanensis TaxID=88456 RepID=A0A6P6S3F2_9EIME|nr:leucine-rich repeat-containing protein 23 [Cyclospora cayetanensis]
MRKEEKAKEGGKTSGAADAEVALNGEVLNRALRDVSRTVDGSGYAFTRLICCGKGVTSLPDALQHYVHLRYIDISGNKISNLTAFSRLPNLLSLNAAENNIEDVSCLASPGALPYLSLLNLSNNRISKAPTLPLQRLTRLSLDANPITTLTGFVYPPSLTHLSLRGTPLESLDCLPLSDTLTSLYLSHTRIQQLLPLEKFPQIKTLDLEGCALPSEQLKVLVSLPMLKEVCLSPLGTSAGDDQFRSEILKVLPRLQWINGREVTSDELTAATTPCETNVQEEMGLDQPLSAARVLKSVVNPVPAASYC